jgi:DNA-binding beta-propeller fold protein YncE
MVLVAAAASLPAGYTPFYGYHYLVAGSGDPGDRDGNFLNSAFKQPDGLALSMDGAKLYVADAGNHAIRVVDLGHDDRVSTLCGGEQGPPSGRLTDPTGLVLSPDGQTLYFLDKHRSLVRSVALAGGRVATLFNANPAHAAASGPAILSGLAALPGGQGLAFVDRRSGSLRQLQLSDGSTKTLALSGRLREADCQASILDHKTLALYGPSGGWIMTWGGGAAGGPGQGLADLADGLAGGEGLAGGNTWDGRPALWIWMPSHGCFKLIRPDGSLEDFLTFDGEGRPLLGTPPPAGPVPRGDSPQRSLFRGPLSLAFDPTLHLIYVAERDSNRVLALKAVPRSARSQTDTSPSYGFFDLNYPLAKAPGVRRVLLVADSLPVLDANHVAMDKLAQMGKRFETFVNLDAAMKGNGAKTEVLTYWAAGPAYGGSPMSTLLKLAPEIKKYQVDQVLVVLSYFTMMTEGLSWARVNSPGDLADGLRDPGWVGLPTSEKEAGLGPLGRDFLGYLRQNRAQLSPPFHWTHDWPYLDDQQSEYKYTEPLCTLPGVRQRVLKKLAFMMAQDAQFGRDQGVTVAYVLMPYRNFLGMGELDGGGTDYSDKTLAASLNAPFKDLARKQGQATLDLFPIIRLISVPMFPLGGYGNPHLLAPSHLWFGWALAQAYLAEKALAPRASRP